MTESADEPRPGTERSRQQARRRARLAELFGEVLPKTASEDRDDDVRRDESASEAWLRAQVPPHHGS